MLRLSPNEEARLLRKETERRRLQRLTQVREKSRTHAAKVRHAVKTEKEKQLDALAAKIQLDWKKEKAERIMQLLQLHDACLKSIGQGHSSAKNWDPKHEESVQLMLQDNHRAEERHRAAIERLRREQALQADDDQQQSSHRLRAREKERLRAKHVAALPPPPPDHLLMHLNQNQGCDMRKVDQRQRSGASKDYPDDGDEDEGNRGRQPVIIEKAFRGVKGDDTCDEEEANGRVAAQTEEDRLSRISQEASRRESERRETARLRHKHALHKEVLHKDYEQLLVELSDLQRADRRRRQQVLERIPRSLYLPPHVVFEKEAERQEKMERQFEELYESVAGNAADIRGQMAPVVPLGGTPTASEDTESAADVALSSRRPHREPLEDVTNVDSYCRGVAASGAADPAEQRKKLAFRKLMKKIEGQKSEWMTRSFCEEQAIENGDNGDSREGNEESPKSSSGSSQNPPSSNGVISTPTLSQYTMESDDSSQATAKRGAVHSSAPPTRHLSAGASRCGTTAMGEDSSLQQYDTGQHCSDESAPPLEWVVQQKQELQRHLEAIAAQRRALESLSSAAGRTPMEERQRPVDGAAISGATEESVREHRVREYQAWVLTRGDASSHAACMPPSYFNREQLLNQRSSMQEKKGQYLSVCGQNFHHQGLQSGDLHIEEHHDERPASPPSIEPSSIGEHSSSDASTNGGSMVPGYVPPQEREALLLSHPFVSDVSSWHTALVSSSCDPAGQRASISIGVAAPPRSLLSAVPQRPNVEPAVLGVVAADNQTDAATLPGYVPVEERSRLLTDFSQPRRTGLASAASGSDSVGTVAAEDVVVVAQDLNPVYGQYQRSRLSQHIPTSSLPGPSRLPSDFSVDATASAVFSAAFARQMQERQDAFNRRQEELKRQLADIQRQKSDILSRQRRQITADISSASTLAILSQSNLSHFTPDTPYASTRQANSDSHIGNEQVLHSLHINRHALSADDTIARRASSSHELSTIDELDDDFDTPSKVSNSVSSADFFGKSKGSFQDGNAPTTYRLSGSVLTASLTTATSSICKDFGVTASTVVIDPFRGLGRTPPVVTTTASLGRPDRGSPLGSWSSTQSSPEGRNVGSPLGEGSLFNVESSSSDNTPTPAVAAIRGAVAHGNADDYGPLRASSRAGLAGSTLLSSSSSSSATASYNPLQLDTTTATESSSSNVAAHREAENERSRASGDCDVMPTSTMPLREPGDGGGLTSCSSHSCDDTADLLHAEQSVRGSTSTSDLLRADESVAFSASSGSGAYKPLPYDSDSRSGESGPSVTVSSVSSDGSCMHMLGGTTSRHAHESGRVVSPSALMGLSVVPPHERFPGAKSSAPMSTQSLVTTDDSNEDEDCLVLRRPHSSTPLRRQEQPSEYVPLSQREADVEFFGNIGAMSLSVGDVSSLSEAGINQEPELTFISLSVSSAPHDETVDNLSQTLTSVHLAHDDYCSDDLHGEDQTEYASIQNSQPKEMRSSSAVQTGQVHLPQSSGSSRFGRANEPKTSSDRKMLDNESKQRTKLLYERLEEVQARKKFRAQEQLRLQTTARRRQYDLKLKQRKSKGDPTARDPLSPNSTVV